MTIMSTGETHEVGAEQTILDALKGEAQSRVRLFRGYLRIVHRG